MSIILRSILWLEFIIICANCIICANYWVSTYVLFFWLQDGGVTYGFQSSSMLARYMDNKIRLWPYMFLVTEHRVWELGLWIKMWRIILHIASIKFELLEELVFKNYTCKIIVTVFLLDYCNNFVLIEFFLLLNTLF